MSNELTLAGVALALLGGVVGSALVEIGRILYAKRQEPKLSVQPWEELSWAEVKKKPCVYARLNICNDRRRKAATGVGVYIEHVSGGSDDDKKKRAFLAGRWLAWANVDRGDPNVPPSMRTIRASTGIDLAHLNNVAPGEVIVDVRPQPPEGSDLNRLGAGTFTFELLVDVHNARPRRFKVDLVHSGEPWDGDYDSASKRLQIGNVRANDE